MENINNIESIYDDNILSERFCRLYFNNINTNKIDYVIIESSINYEEVKPIANQILDTLKKDQQQFEPRQSPWIRATGSSNWSKLIDRKLTATKTASATKSKVLMAMKLASGGASSDILAFEFETTNLSVPQLRYAHSLALEIYQRSASSMNYHGNLELSTQEQFCLASLAGGKSDAEIGTELGLSEFTIEHYVRNILIKLGAKSRAQAIAIASRTAEFGLS